LGVTESEWLTSADFGRLISAPGVTCSPRKAALLGCAMFYTIARSVSVTELFWVVRVIEKMADGNATSDERRTSFEVANFAYNVTTGTVGWIPAQYKRRSAFPVSWAVYHLQQMADYHIPRNNKPDALRTYLDMTWDGFNGMRLRRKTVLPIFCTRLRCILGNPFRPVTFLNSWRSETAVALASAIYAERAFDRLPILADALQEAGCDHADVLEHCRHSGPHARGCWVVDGVLGKS
jgi:hypothetical protein